MRVNTIDGVCVTGHFCEVIGEAQRNNATSISIQDFYTFCNFNTREDAQRFLDNMHTAGKADGHGVNTERPFVKFEVSIHHPK